MATTSAVRINVNGIDYERSVEPRLLLVHFLRDYCNLTGTHVGCETSLCGACTVLIDGKAVKSCTVLAVQMQGRKVITVEGLAAGDTLHPVQQGFWECHGLQCGCSASTRSRRARRLLTHSKAICAAAPATRTSSMQSSTPRVPALCRPEVRDEHASEVCR